MKWLNALFTMVVVSTLACSCRRDGDNSTSATFKLIPPENQNATVELIAFKESKSLDLQFSKVVAKNKLTSDRIKNQMGEQQARKFLAELEDYVPSPFSLDSWYSVIPSRIFLPDTNEVWLVFCRYVPAKADMVIRIKSPQALTGEEFLILLKGTLINIHTNWSTYSKQIAVSDSEMFDANGEISSPKIKSLIHGAEFLRQR
ncbi:MAG: hypothetical protein HOP33_17485 [Verrucomicrobia bacterium]|nr:hypothetical protein [Verrucomicrobiota bacterium]